MVSSHYACSADSTGLRTNELIDPSGLANQLTGLFRSHLKPTYLQAAPKNLWLNCGKCCQRLTQARAPIASRAFPWLHVKSLGHFVFSTANLVSGQRDPVGLPGAGRCHATGSTSPGEVLSVPQHGSRVGREGQGCPFLWLLVLESCPQRGSHPSVPSFDFLWFSHSAMWF